MKGRAGAIRKVMLPLPYAQTITYWQGGLNLSDFVRKAWHEDRLTRRDFPTGMSLGHVALKGTTLSLDPATAADIDAVRRAIPGFNFSRWVARALHERMANYFPELGY